MKIKNWVLEHYCSNGGLTEASSHSTVLDGDTRKNSVKILSHVLSVRTVPGGCGCFGQQGVLCDALRYAR